MPDINIAKLRASVETCAHDIPKAGAVMGHSLVWERCRWCGLAGGQILAMAQDEVTALLDRVEALEGALAVMVRQFREETSEGDGIREEHVAGYEAARAVLAREGGR